MNTQKIVSIGGKPGIVLLTPSGFDSLKKYPVALFLHGIGERGDGSDAGLTSLANFMAIFAGAVDAEGFIIVAPQLRSTIGDWDLPTIQGGVDFIKSQSFFDPERFYLTGISLGGGGVWKYASSNAANCNQFAAIVPVCGVWGMGIALNMRSVPVWAFHATNDGTVPVSNTTSQVGSVNNAGPLIPAKATLYTTGGHSIWDRVYSANVLPGTGGESVTVWQWFKLNKVGNPVAVPIGGTVVLPPPVSGLVANAGPDMVITTDTFTLDGTGSTGYKEGTWFCNGVTDETGKELWKWWEIKMVDSPPGWWGIKQNIKNLLDGVYTFTLTVRDAAGVEKKDTMKLTVKKAVVITPPPAKEVFVTSPIPAGATTVTVYTDKSIDFK